MWESCSRISCTAVRPAKRPDLEFKCLHQLTVIENYCLVKVTDNNSGAKYHFPSLDPGKVFILIFVEGEKRGGKSLFKMNVIFIFVHKEVKKFFFCTMEIVQIID